VRGRTATGTVVKRKTRNEGNTHHKLVVPRVQPLLKCALSCRVRTPFEMDGEARGHPLNAACMCTTHNTTVSQSSSSINSSPSHTSSSQSPHSRLFDRPRRESWPHTAVKQDGRKVTHTSPYDHLPAAANSCSHSTPPLNPLSTGCVRTRHSGWIDDIAASCISRVATTACAEGGGALEEGWTNSVGVQIKLLPRNTISLFHSYNTYL
jgi:hypothetical protein